MSAPATGRELAIPTGRDLEALTPAERWQLEAALEEVGPRLREMNDAELRRWVEVEGRTQTEIAEMVGLSQQAIAKRCAKLGIKPRSNRGRPRGITTGGNSDPDEEEEVLDGEVVDDGPAPNRCPRCKADVRVDREHDCPALDDHGHPVDRDRPDLRQRQAEAARAREERWAQSDWHKQRIAKVEKRFWASLGSWIPALADIDFREANESNDRYFEAMLRGLSDSACRDLRRNIKKARARLIDLDRDLERTLAEREANGGSRS